MMQGRPLQEAVTGVPRMFAVCGRAQGVAAAMAAEAALGKEVSDAVHALRMRLILGEIVHEYLWRMMLDWPLLAGLPPRVQALAVMRTKLDDLLKSPLAVADWSWSAFIPMLQDCLRREVLGCDPAQWLALDTLQALERWCEKSQAPAAEVLRGLPQRGSFGMGGVALMPEPEESWLRESAVRMARAEFAHQPEWRGVPQETGALARQHRHPLLRTLIEAQGNSVLVRMVARLAELAHLATGGGKNSRWFGSLPLGNGSGMAWVETARGLLMHRIASDGDRVLQYRIVAPTEWNFHANGALARGLGGMTAQSADGARKQAQWLVQSLDPCVACEITLKN